MCVPECSVITSSAEALVRASASPALVAAVQLQQHARLVRRPHRRAGVARLLEVVDARAAQRVERGHSTGPDLAPVRLRQQRQRDDREHVAEHAEGDRAAEPDGRREEADDAREQRPERRGRRCNRSPRRSPAPASGTARTGRSRSPRSSRRRRSRAGSRRSAASCWSPPARGSTRPATTPASAANSANARRRPSRSCTKPARQVAEERARDDHEQVAARADDRQVALRLQVGRDPGEHRVVAALDAGREQRGDDRRLQQPPLRICFSGTSLVALRACATRGRPPGPRRASARRGSAAPAGCRGTSARASAVLVANSSNAIR